MDSIPGAVTALLKDLLSAPAGRPGSRGGGGSAGRSSGLEIMFRDLARPGLTTSCMRDLARPARRHGECSHRCGLEDHSWSYFRRQRSEGLPPCNPRGSGGGRGEIDFCIFYRLSDATPLARPLSPPTRARLRPPDPDCVLR